MNPNTLSPGATELYGALKSVKRHFFYVGGFSAAVNLLQLVPIMYMLNVYDRVMSGGSIPTLLTLTFLMVFLLIALGGFEQVRSRILVAASNKLEMSLRDRVFNATVKNALEGLGPKFGTQALQDLNGLRQFMTGNGVFAFFDAPWFFIYLAVMFSFHSWFGYSAIFAGIVMIVFAYVNEKLTNAKMKEANNKANMNTNQMASNLRNVEVIEAMGMSNSIRARSQQQNDEVLLIQSEASRFAGKLSAISKSFRMIVQSMMIGLGAYLAINQEISAGMVIAGSLLLGRALAPIDLLVNTWKGFSVARAEYERLETLLTNIPATKEKMRLPAPLGALSLEQVYVGAPGSKNPILRAINFELAAGEVLGIIGPSASGKSTLARACLGLWGPLSGKVRLDGADITNWDRGELGSFLGYLPQDIELFDGSISENIARFGTIDAEKIVAAAKLAGVHELVLQQPNGYDTVIGGNSGMLSGGQRQRLGLARAIYGEPRLLVLDEPNSNLDDQGEKELVVALQRIKETGCTILVIGHRAMILRVVDKILILKEGTMVNFGPRDQVLAELTQGRKAPKLLIE